MKQSIYKMTGLFRDFGKCEDGVAAIEYALIAAATGLALAASLPSVINGLSVTYTTILGFF